jgi:hypothetical protein
MKEKENLYDAWSFVEKDLDQDQWYVGLTGGKYDGVVYNYEDIKMLPDEETLTFDYTVIEFCDDDPEGKPEFNGVVGEILTLVLEDAIQAKDYVIGDKRNTDNTK